VPARDLIEDLTSKEMERGLWTEIHNSRALRGAYSQRVASRPAITRRRTLSYSIRPSTSLRRPLPSAREDAWTHQASRLLRCIQTGHLPRWDPPRGRQLAGRGWLRADTYAQAPRRNRVQPRASRRIAVRAGVRGDGRALALPQQL